MQDKKWIRKFKHPENPIGRLVILPHAGGSANFYTNLYDAMDENIECIGIQYPGRQDRFFDPLAATIEEMADGATDALLKLPVLPTILFGHSMGGTVGYDMLKRYSERLSFIKALVASASTPRYDKEVEFNSDDKLIEHLQDLGGFNSLMAMDPNVLELILPTMKSDLSAIDLYTKGIFTKITTPTLAMVGKKDVASVQHCDDWQFLTEDFRGTMYFSGDHFYILEEYAAVAAELRKLL